MFGACWDLKRIHVFTVYGACFRDVKNLAGRRHHRRAARRGIKTNAGDDLGSETDPISTGDASSRRDVDSQPHSAAP
jgi:hypothetical protein